MTINIRIDREGADPMATSKRSVEGRRLSRKTDWVEGWWENIAPQPIYIKDKYHLKEVCKKYSTKDREIIPKAFIKPKSQGKGYEWSF